MDLKKLPKVVVFLLCLGFIFSLTAVAEEVVVESKISEVTVYPDSALLRRTASLNLKAGEFKVIFADIIPDVDENSLRVSARGTAGVKLFGSQLRREYLEQAASERIKQLFGMIQESEDEIKVLQNQRKLLLEKKSFLDSVRFFSGSQIPKDLATEMPSPRELEDLLKFLGSRLKENYSLIAETDIKIRESTNKLNTLKEELAQISRPQRRLKRSIVVELEVIKPGIVDLDLTYMVRGVSWRPLYDARANFQKSEVELISYGVVKQVTGKDWQDVEISLSTAKPAIDAKMPDISPWFLRPYQPPVAAPSLRDKVAFMAQEMALDEAVGARREVIPEFEYAKVQETGVAVDYKLTRRVNIKADGSEHKLPISTQNLKAEFDYLAYPRVSNFAYLGSRVTNSPDLQLLGGQVNIFLEGSFVGSSGIDNVAPGEEFDLYLGVDENVKVKRELLEKKVDDRWIAGIPSRTKRTSFKYKFSVGNYKSRRINMRLFEALPVSEDERIKIKINRVSQEPSQKDWQDKKGIWLWNLELEPREEQDIFYDFTVEHPRDMRIEGL